ncbi:MAG: thioredoxin family protein [Fuerstiella sp.]|nr:thioredoxin family protein [Fuerstiella sp.]
MSVCSFTPLLTVCFLATPDMDLFSGMPPTEMQPAVNTPEVSHDWLNSYEEAKELAAKSKLPLLLHFDATWCGACRRMDRDVLHREQVTALLGQSVIGVRIDSDQHKKLTAEFKISTLPTEVVVFADGTVGGRYVGAVSLDTYVARLRKISGRNSDVVASQAPQTDDISESDSSKRSCLIVRHDGKVVGVSGYSPVALTVQRQWKKGSDRFVATHEGVDYFLQSEEEVRQFNDKPDRYIPRLHGCDLVELFQENRATAGSIEYGSFYLGEAFFFASLENRERFVNNPTWFLGVMADARTANNEKFPFLRTGSVDN